MREAFRGVHGPTLVDRFLEHAIEIDVDALCDGTERVRRRRDAARRRGGRPLGRLGVRAPAAVARRSGRWREISEIVRRLGPALGVVGLLNVQLAVVDGEVFVLEVNPRASRTVPFASKAIGINLVAAACRLAAGSAARRARAAARAGRRGR